MTRQLKRASARARDGKDRYGLARSGPFDRAHISRRVPAVSLLVAAP
ncbi:hypothetical protein ACFY4C_04310 [Actinomadura viridis]